MEINKDRTHKLFLCLAIALTLGIVIYFWLINSSGLLFQGTAEACLALGRLFGLLAVYCILLQLLLIGRVSWIEKIVGHDRLSHLHHLNGLMAWIFIIFHPILIITSYALVGKISFLHQFIIFVSSYPKIPFALAAWILFIVIIITSINLIKRKIKYEYWMLIHLFVYVAILLAFSHQLKFGGDLQNKLFASYWYILYFFAFGNLIIFRAAVPIYKSYTQDYKIDRIVRETHNVVSIYIKGKDLQKLSIKPGQFMIFRFLSKGFWWEAHPFSVSNINTKKEIRISIKSVGDFTSKINHIKPETKVLIEGPYGRFTDAISTKDKFLLIAGGIGVTPIRTIIESLSSNKKDVILIYSNRTKEDILFKKELSKIAKRKNVKIYYIVTSDKAWKGDSRRLNLEVIQHYIKDIQDRDSYICGPPRMIESIKKSLQSIGIPRRQIHYEKFSLG